MKFKLKKLVSALMVVVGSISFTIPANAASKVVEDQSTTKKTGIESEKELKKLSGAQLFVKATEAYGKAKAKAEDGDYKVAYMYALEGAKKKNADAQLLLSLLYQVGYGVELNVDAAAEWRKKAAKNGSIDAKGVIAVMGIAQDLNQQHVKELKPYAEEAFKADSIFGLAAMAYVLHDGYGGDEPKEQEGRMLLMKAMSKSDDQLNFFERIYIDDIRQLSLEIN